MWSKLHGSEHRPIASCCEHGDGKFFIKISQIVGQLSDHQCRNENIAQTAQLASRTHPDDELP